MINTTTNYVAYSPKDGKIIGLCSDKTQFFTTEKDFKFLEITIDEASLICGNTTNHTKIIDGKVVYIPEADEVLLAHAKQEKLNNLSYFCQKTIKSGFQSLDDLMFASGDNAQRNLVQAAQSSKGGVLSTVDASGKITRSLYTQAQAQSALEDFVEFRGKNEMQLSALEAQVAAAETVDAVQAVVWEDPK